MNFNEVSLGRVNNLMVGCSTSVFSEYQMEAINSQEPTFRSIGELAKVPKMERWLSSSQRVAALLDAWCDPRQVTLTQFKASQHLSQGVLWISLGIDEQQRLRGRIICAPFEPYLATIR